MVAMIVNAKLALNEFCNAQCRPDICLIPVRQRPLQQIPDQTELLSARQARGPAGCWLGSKSPLPAVSKGITPSHCRTGVAANATCHFVQGVAFLDESHGTKTPSLQLCGRSLGAHRTHPPVLVCAIVLHYLCRSQ
jgi:hypothetical protein